MKEENKRKSIRWVFILLGILFILLFISDLLLGSIIIPLKQIVLVFFPTAETNETFRTIILEFRLPKALTAILTGAALSVSGLQMQTVFRNPLAGPFVLGISAGASLGVALFVLGFSSVLVFGLVSVTGAWTLAIVAWTGSFLVMLLVLYVSARVNDIMTILILGILFSSAVAAIVSILQYFSNESMLKAFVIWTMGSLGSVTNSQLSVLTPAILAGIILALVKIKDLNAFLLGENYARSLGVRIIKSRIIIFLSTSLLAGTITAFCGPIGFIGIAVPHICRVIFKTSNHLILIPAVILTGSIVMLFSDILSQLPGMQTTLPINSVTAIIGIPVIMWMIIRNKKFTSVA
ncbi:MAG: iron ABC transporter permease [Prolixibacteraceae bacterium]|jgi:iron complex transport system permease protein|nr:iron ABC transporter permease [Prolixibacteraceae bacterium]MBT6764307.1 iron ABC transporter permease [Prolixibacteraceae bacterium]MBT6997856.1 iron ABC transporter permease [Prolixibacteraceae bacterium]MBT7394429.1 iron ABC transporter permease [Prolixibacteraceae bacterium]